MSNEPFLSIIIPCYNHGKYILECVNSIFSLPNISNIEVILINDGSTDNGYTKSVLDKLSHPCLTVIHQENQGLGKTRNNAIILSKGKYILPLDADNYLEHDFIVKALNILEKNPDIDIVYPDRKFIFENGKTKIVKTGMFEPQKLILGNFIDACAVFKKNVWEHIHGYDENMPVMGYEDWDFWIRCSNNGFNFHYLEGTYFYYRVLENSMLSNAVNKGEIIMPYVIHKNVNFFAAQLQNYKLELSYLNRKPLRYLFKKFLKTNFNFGN